MVALSVGCRHEQRVVGSIRCLFISRFQLRPREVGAQFMGGHFAVTGLFQEQRNVGGHTPLAVQTAAQITEAGSRCFCGFCNLIGSVFLEVIM